MYTKRDNSKIILNQIYVIYELYNLQNFNFAQILWINVAYKFYM